MVMMIRCSIALLEASIESISTFNDPISAMFFLSGIHRGILRTPISSLSKKEELLEKFLKTMNALGDGLPEKYAKFISPDGVHAVEVNTKTAVPPQKILNERLLSMCETGK